MGREQLVNEAASLANSAKDLSEYASRLAAEASLVASDSVTQSIDSGFFLHGVTVFILACFIGYYVVWRVTPALHSPLMAVTNAISSVIIVGALVAAGPMGWSFAKIFGFLAITLASVNIFGGFIVTQRMLHMFIKKK